MAQDMTALGGGGSAKRTSQHVIRLAQGVVDTI